MADWLAACELTITVDGVGELKAEAERLCKLCADTDTTILHFSTPYCYKQSPREQAMHALDVIKDYYGPGSLEYFTAYDKVTKMESEQEKDPCWDKTAKAIMPAGSKRILNNRMCNKCRQLGLHWEWCLIERGSGEMQRREQGWRFFTKDMVLHSHGECEEVMAILPSLYRKERINLKSPAWEHTFACGPVMKDWGFPNVPQVTHAGSHMNNFSVLQEDESKRIAGMLSDGLTQHTYKRFYSFDIQDHSEVRKFIDFVDTGCKATKIIFPAQGTIHYEGVPEEVLIAWNHYCTLPKRERDESDRSRGAWQSSWNPDAKRCPGKPTEEIHEDNIVKDDEEVGFF